MSDNDRFSAIFAWFCFNLFKVGLNEIVSIIEPLNEVPILRLDDITSVSVIEDITGRNLFHSVLANTLFSVIDDKTPRVLFNGMVVNDRVSVMTVPPVPRFLNNGILATASVSAMVAANPRALPPSAAETAWFSVILQVKVFEPAVAGAQPNRGVKYHISKFFLYNILYYIIYAT